MALHICTISRCVAGWYLFRRLVLPVIRLIVKRTPWLWDDVLFEAGVFKRFARIIPPLIFTMV